MNKNENILEGIKLENIDHFSNVTQKTGGFWGRLASKLSGSIKAVALASILSLTAMTGMAPLATEAEAGVRAKIVSGWRCTNMKSFKTQVWNKVTKGIYNEDVYAFYNGNCTAFRYNIWNYSSRYAFYKGRGHCGSVGSGKCRKWRVSYNWNIQGVSNTGGRINDKVAGFKRL